MIQRSVTFGPSRTRPAEAAIYARYAGTWDPKHLKRAARILRDAGLATTDGELLAHAMRWDSTHGDDEAVGWALYSLGRMTPEVFLQRFPHSPQAAAVQRAMRDLAPASDKDIIEYSPEETPRDMAGARVEAVREGVSVTVTAPSVTAAGSLFAQLLDEAPRRPLTPDELAPLTRRELALLRNSLYARHGRRFQNPQIQEFMNTMPWYRENGAYSDSLLTPVDRSNVMAISNIEQRR